MFNEVVKLITAEKTVNQYGDTILTDTEREVFAELKSIGQSEFYQASAIGLKPEIKFVLPDFLEYKGELRLKYQPYGQEEQEYSVIRTYQNGITMELICKRGVDD